MPVYPYLIGISLEMGVFSLQGGLPPPGAALLPPPALLSDSELSFTPGDNVQGPQQHAEQITSPP